MKTGSQVMLGSSLWIIVESSHIPESRIKELKEGEWYHKDDYAKPTWLEENQYLRCILRGKYFIPTPEDEIPPEDPDDGISKEGFTEKDGDNYEEIKEYDENIEL